MKCLIFFLLLIGSTLCSAQLSFAQTQITLNTDKGSYGPGDTVKITGNVAGASNQLVGIQVKDAGGNLILIRTVQTDSGGNFVLQFKVPGSATAGNFTIQANAKINGQVVTSTKTITQAIPEFGSVVGIISICSIIGMIMVSRQFKFLPVS